MYVYMIILLLAVLCMLKIDSVLPVHCALNFKLAIVAYTLQIILLCMHEY